jgi:short-subunit dehydrogenase
MTELITDQNLKKSALITGASSGIGAAFARKLAQLGYDLILVARREELILEMKVRLENQYGIHIENITADLSKEADIACVEKCIRSQESLDMLVNNAGFSVTGKFSTLDIEDHLAMINVHVIASVRFSHAALPAMIKADRGAIINVSSMAALLPLRNVTYSSTKAYLVTFSKALQNELIGSGVTVQALCPGFTYSEFHDSRKRVGFRRSDIPRFLWGEAEDVVAVSLNALPSKKLIVIPGTINKLIVGIGTNAITGPIIRSASQMITKRKR